MTEECSPLSLTFLLIKSLPCMACGREGPSQAHHCGGGSMKDRGIHKGKGTKNADALCIPLCEHHHTGAEGIHSIGVLTWEAKYGTQAEMLDKLGLMLGIDLWERARREQGQSKVYHRDAA